MEYFELTFFVDKCSVQVLDCIENILRENLQLSTWRNPAEQRSERILSNREVVFERFEYQEKEYSEFMLSIGELYFTKKNFDQQVNDLTHLVHRCFQLSPYLPYATGIYETTYYWTSECSTLSDVKQATLEHFPFLFFRDNANQDHRFVERNGCFYFYQDHLQDIFANPIRSMMLDNQVSEDEAIKRLDISNCHE